MVIKGKTYDTLKFLAQIAFPAFASAYFALAGIWNLPAPEQVVGTIVVLDTFLGALLQISSNSFTANTAKGVLNVETTPTGTKQFNLELEGDPEKEIEGKDRVIFEVKKKR